MLCKPNGSKISAAGWEHSTLRRLLNGDFQRRAFTGRERKRIFRPGSENEGFPGAGESVNDVSDPVFCLSAAETELYFGSADGRRCLPTAFAMRDGCGSQYDKESRYCWWWLRNGGRDASSKVPEPCHAAVVDPDGNIDYDGFSVSQRRISVRPAIRVILN